MPSGRSAIASSPRTARFSLSAIAIGHCVMRQRPAVRPEQPPRPAPLALAELGPTTPERCGSLVEVRDPPGGVGGVDGGRQRIDQVAEEAVAPDRAIRRLSRPDARAAAIGQLDVAQPDDIRHAVAPVRLTDEACKKRGKTNHVRRNSRRQCGTVPLVPLSNVERNVSSGCALRSTRSIWAAGRRLAGVSKSGLSLLPAARLLLVERLQMRAGDVMRPLAIVVSGRN